MGGNQKVVGFDDIDGIPDDLDDDRDGDGFTNAEEGDGTTDGTCVGDGGNADDADVTPDDLDGDAASPQLEIAYRQESRAECLPIGRLRQSHGFHRSA